MKLPVKARIRNSKGGKYQNWVISIPAQYVKNGLLKPGQEYNIEIDPTPIPEAKNSESWIRTTDHATLGGFVAKSHANAFGGVLRFRGFLRAGT